MSPAPAPTGKYSISIAAGLSEHDNNPNVVDGVAEGDFIVLLKRGDHGQMQPICAVGYEQLEGASVDSIVFIPSGIGGDLAIATQHLGTCQVGRDVEADYIVGGEFRMFVNGGSPEYTWEVSDPEDSAPLPPGMELSSFGTFCDIIGTPTTAGSYVFTIKVTDGNGVIGTQLFEINVLNKAVPTHIANLIAVHKTAIDSPADGTWQDPSGEVDERKILLRMSFVGLVGSPTATVDIKKASDALGTGATTIGTLTNAAPELVWDLDGVNPFLMASQLVVGGTGSPAAAVSVDAYQVLRP